MNREKIKMLILLSKDVEEADSVIINQGFIAVKEKIAFLKGMFNFTLIGRYSGSHDLLDTEVAYEMDYYAILSTILCSRWEDE